MLYRFNVSCIDYDLFDDDGLDLPDDESAIDVGELLIAKLEEQRAEKDFSEPYRLKIRDANGREVLSIPLATFH